MRGHKGASVHVRELCRAFDRLGHSVTIMSPHLGPAEGPAPAAELVEVPLPRIADNGLDAAALRERQARAYADVLFDAARKLAAVRPFDAIYERYSLWSDVGARLSHATGLPLVLEVNAPLREEAARYRDLHDGNTAAAVERAQLTTAHNVVVVSQRLAEYVTAHGASPARVLVLPNAVDPQRFHPAVRGGAVHHRYGLQGKTIIGFAGRVRPWHDIETLLRAFARLHATDNAYHLLLVGQTPPELPQQLTELGIATAATLTGPVPHAEIPAHLAAMDVAVSSHAPLHDFYFSPLKLFEYLACGVPTVAADIGQPSEIIRPGKTGLLYPPGDDAALAAQIRWMVDHERDAREMAWQGAALVLKNHTWAHNAQAVVERLVPPTPTATVVREADTARPAPELPIVDDKLRQRLYRATRPDLAAPLLKRALACYGRRGSERLQSISDITVFKYKSGRRCVLGYTLNGRVRGTQTRTQRRVIGKIFRDERGRRLLALQQRLWQAEFAPGTPDRIMVPAGLGYVPKMRMLVQEWSPGQTLNELVTQRSIHGRIPRCAQALAKLHSTSAFAGSDLLGTYSLEQELANLDRFTENLAESRPAAYADAAVMRDALRQWAGWLPEPETAVPIHRDFYYSQMLFDGADLYLIDFDLLALSDPAIDVANFCAHLHFMGADLLDGMDALAAEADAFKAAYATYRPVNAAFWERVRFHEAATFFRLLNVIAPRPGLVHLYEAVQARTARYLGVLAP